MLQQQQAHAMGEQGGRFARGLHRTQAHLQQRLLPGQQCFEEAPMDADDFRLRVGAATGPVCQRAWPHALQQVKRQIQIAWVLSQKAEPGQRLGQQGFVRLVFDHPRLRH